MKPFDFKPKAVLFDMDGVLVDTEPMSRAGWTKALLKMGFVLTEEAYANILAGSNFDGCRKRLKAMFGEELDYEEVARMRNEYVHAFRDENGVELKKGVLNLLSTLEELGISCSVATSTIKKHAEDLLESLGLLKYFKKVIGGDDVINGKPDPEIYLKAAKAMNARPDECLVIEDSRLGTEAAYRGGIKVIVVPDLQEPDETCRARAYAVCKDLDEVATRIKKAERV